jgi:hypothetical protein
MQALEGIECRLTLCDGARPQIVIQPDISLAEIVFSDLWARLRIAFSQIGEIGPFTLSDFNVSFLPPRHWSERPPLSYRDALAIYRARQGHFLIDHSGLCHLITFLTVGAAYRVGLEGRYALVFCVIVGYLVSGMQANPGVDFEQDVALSLFNRFDDPTFAALGKLFNQEHWEEAQAGFRRIYDQVRAWQTQPELYEEIRRQRWSGLHFAPNGHL